METLTSLSMHRLPINFLGVKHWLYFIISSFYMSVGAQSSVDTSIRLPAIMVMGGYGIGDTLNHPLADIKTWAQRRATFYIKDSGPGQLATMSIRGASSSQSGIYWNGIDIRNPMLGLVDLSQLNLMGISSVSVVESGLYDHQIHLGGALDIKSYLSNLTAGMDAGVHFTQYGIWKSSIGHRIVSPKAIYATGFKYQGGSNAFSYRNTLGDILKQSHANLSSWSFNHTTKKIFDSDKTLRIDLWLRGQNSQLAPRVSQSISRAHQSDQNYRLVIRYRDDHRVVKEMSLAWLHDRIFFADSLIGIFAHSSSTTYLLKNRLTILDTWLTWQGGLDIKRISARADNYNHTQHQNRLTWSSTWQRSWSDQWISAVWFNQKWVDNKVIQPSYSIKSQHYFSSRSSIYALITRAIRLPDLNDLYWSPGGNPDLKPEKAWKIEFGYKTFVKSLRLAYQVTPFTSWTRDWILWRPVNGSVWSPINVRNVWSSGVSQQVTMPILINPHQQIKLHLSHEWVRAVYQNKLSPSDQSLGRQLIYTPVHKLLGHAAVRVHDWMIDSHFTYSSKVYTRTDHSDHIDAYGLVDLKVARRWKNKNMEWYGQIALYNITNRTYYLVPDRAMPLRYFSITLNFQFLDL